MITKLRAKLRNWLFADYKYITRAQVNGRLCAKMWEHCTDSIVDTRICEALFEVMHDLNPAMKALTFEEYVKINAKLNDTPATNRS